MGFGFLASEGLGSFELRPLKIMFTVVIGTLRWKNLLPGKMNLS